MSIETITTEDLLVELARRGIRSVHESAIPKIITCPNCGRAGLVERDFGVRVTELGELRSQSWCKPCRGTKEVSS